MQYLKSFKLATDNDELDFIFSARKSFRLDMSCYSVNNAYPFHIFPNKGLERIDFSPITVIYGGNGSGKSTLLNVIAEKLKLARTAPFNDSPMMSQYLEYCEYELCSGVKSLPNESEIITSDGVFDFLLDVRAINSGVDRERERLLDEYRATSSDCTNNGWQMKDLSQYDELKRRNEVRRKTRSQYVSKRLFSTELQSKSNGESAFIYFTQRIKENAFYLLDEPENSLSAKLQAELARFIEDSVRFYGCQFVISTHSPFILSIKNAKIYDLDSSPVSVKRWSELENIIAYCELFLSRKKEFNDLTVHNEDQ